MQNISPTLRRYTLVWLSLCAFLVVSMIMLGGATRLTESGLSIVAWKPISGILPPLSEAAWIQEFEHYKQFPEYAQKHMDMTLPGFKFIYFMEYSHRLLGRILGLVFLLPFLFLYKSMPAWLKHRSYILLGLGGAQGVMGWLMVKSGLVNIPYVSHYRLALHLMLAFALLAVMLSTLYRVMNPPRFLSTPPTRALKIILHSTLMVLTLTIIYGAFVAGLRAGTIYNTFPLMGGEWIPFEWNFLTPTWLNFFENQATVQWVHRLLGTFTCVLCITVSILLWQGQRKRQSLTLLALITVQYTLGIKTLLFGVPIPLALLHQLGAVLVWSYMIGLKMSLRNEIYP